MKRFRLLILLLASSLIASGCAPSRIPITPGTIPEQASVSSTDEQYGHEVLAKLTERYPLSNDDKHIERVRNVVERLSSAANATGNPWHAYVLVGDNFKNAAATRGNFIFVWTGMLREVKDDTELATVLAHEMGHALAGHTLPDPAEEANAMMAGIAGNVAKQIVYRQGGTVAGLAGLAGVLVAESIKAIIVNPESQRQELEADHIGLFIMARAGYNPQKAIEFWKRVQLQPGFSGSSLDFLSSHPSSESRIQRLEEYSFRAQWMYIRENLLVRI